MNIKIPYHIMPWEIDYALLSFTQLKKYSKPIHAIPAIICNHLNKGCTNSIKPPIVVGY